MSDDTSNDKPDGKSGDKAQPRGPLEKLGDLVDAVVSALGGLLAPPPELVPVPIPVRRPPPSRRR